MKPEYRSLGSAPKVDEAGVIIGRAATFNNPTLLYTDPKTGVEYWETIAPGAFDRALREGQDVRALIDHEPAMLLGRTASRTLALSVDSSGLLVRITLPDTSYARDLRAVMSRGDLTEMSFGFTAGEGGQTVSRYSSPSGKPAFLRTLTDVDLYDVSVVTYPAYEGTGAILRADLRSRFDCFEQASRSVRDALRFQKLRLIKAKLSIK